MTAVGIKTYPEAPEAFTGPGAVVETVANYLSDASTFGHITVRYDVIVLINSSPRWIKEVEAMIPTAMQALNEAGWHVENVSLEQFVITASNRVFNGTRLTVSAEVPIKEIN